MSARRPSSGRARRRRARRRAGGVPRRTSDPRTSSPTISSWSRANSSRSRAHGLDDRARALLREQPADGDERAGASGEMPSRRRAAAPSVSGCQRSTSMPLRTTWTRAGSWPPSTSVRPTNSEMATSRRRGQRPAQHPAHPRRVVTDVDVDERAAPVSRPSTTATNASRGRSLVWMIADAAALDSWPAGRSSTAPAPSRRAPAASGGERTRARDRGWPDDLEVGDRGQRRVGGRRVVPPGRRRGRRSVRGAIEVPHDLGVDPRVGTERGRRRGVEEQDGSPLAVGDRSPHACMSAMYLWTRPERPGLIRHAMATVRTSVRTVEGGPRARSSAGPSLRPALRRRRCRSAVRTVSAVPVGYLGVLTAAAWFATAPADHRRRRARDARFAVLVPAHDEEPVIAETLPALAALDYPAELRRSTSSPTTARTRTVELVAAAGVDVREHTSSTRQGPGAGVADRRGARRADRRTPVDAVVIVDADTVVAPGFLRAIDGAARRRGRTVVQGQYRVRDPGASTGGGAALRRAAAAPPPASARPHRARRLVRAVRQRHGVPREVLRRRAWSDHLTEDIELQMELLLEGVLVAYAPDAVVEAEMPATLGAPRTQNERWERGRIELARRYVPRLARAGPPGCRAPRRRGRRGARPPRARRCPCSSPRRAPRRSPAPALAWLRGVKRPLQGLGLVAAWPSTSCRASCSPGPRRPCTVAAARAGDGRVEGAAVGDGCCCDRAEGWARTARARRPTRSRAGTRSRRDGAPRRGPARRAGRRRDDGRGRRRDRGMVAVAGAPAGAPGRHRQRRLRRQRGHRRRAARRSCSATDLSIPDGMPVVWAARLCGTPIRERTTGVDLVPALVERAARTGCGCAVRRRARRGRPGRRVLARAVPGRRRRGRTGADGRRRRVDGSRGRRRLRASGPTSSASPSATPSRSAGSPATAQAVGAPVCIGIGGTLDFLTGVTKRAPRWMQRAGLEWLHRAPASRAGWSAATPTTCGCSARPSLRQMWVGRRRRHGGAGARRTAIRPAPAAVHDRPRPAVRRLDNGAVAEVAAACAPLDRAGAGARRDRSPRRAGPGRRRPASGSRVARGRDDETRPLPSR